MCPRLSANYVSCCPPNMAQVSVWAGNLQIENTVCVVEIIAVATGICLNRNRLSPTIQVKI